MTNGYYTILDAIKTALTSKGFKVVTYGPAIEIDLDRQTIYPYAHIVPSTASMDASTTTFDFEVIGCDLVDFSKAEVTNDFLGNTNLQDVHQDILARLQAAVKLMDYGQDYSLSNITLDAFQERFKNVLAGWTLSFSIEIPNLDDGRC